MWRTAMAISETWMANCNALMISRAPPPRLVSHCINWRMLAANYHAAPSFPRKAGIQGGFRSVGPGYPLSRA
jgi:hypothetical protein